MNGLADSNGEEKCLIVNEIGHVLNNMLQPHAASHQCYTLDSLGGLLPETLGSNVQCSSLNVSVHSESKQLHKFHRIYYTVPSIESINMTAATSSEQQHDKKCLLVSIPVELQLSMCELVVLED